MSDVPNVPRPSQLWKELPDDGKLQAADAFWRDEHARAEQMEAIAAIAARIKFRAKSVISMPVEKKARQLTGLAGMSELVAARLLVAYHLAQQRPMMGAFLDAVGIAHENGLIADEDVKAPNADTLRAAAKSLASSYPATDVSRYLTMLVWQDPETWGPLAETPEVTATT